VTPASAPDSAEPPAVLASLPSSSPTGSLLSAPSVAAEHAQRHEEADSYRRALQESIADFEHEHGVEQQEQEQVPSAEPSNEGQAPGEQ